MAQPQPQTGFGSSSIDGGEQINKLVAKRSNKKRVQPILISDVPSASTSNKITNGASNRAHPSVTGQLQRHTDGATPVFPSSRFSAPESRHPSYSASPAPSIRGFDADVEMGGPLDMDVPIDAIDTSFADTNRAKRKASAIDEGDRPTRARTLGGDQPRTTIDIHVIDRNKHDMPGDLLPIPPILTLLSTSVDDSEDILEGRNVSEEGGPCMFINSLDISNHFYRSLGSTICQSQTNAVARLPSVSHNCIDSNLGILCSGDPRCFSQCIFAYGSEVGLGM